MKKLLIVFGVFIAGSPFVSCKKMKDDIKDLKNQVTDLKSQNDTLKNQNNNLKDQTDTLKNRNSVLQEKLNGVINSLGSDEPIAATTTFQDNTGATRTVIGSYKFKASDYSTQRAIKNSNGTYYIYIERFSDVEWYEGAWTEFTYNPTTKAVTNASGGQYWSDADSYYDNARYEGSYTGTGLTLNITVDNFNTATGAISMKFAAAATGTYTNAVDPWYTPNQGKSMSTNFTFAGKLKVFDQN
ncbi:MULTISPECIES: cell division protein ZapB [Niastella]|uniref:Cell division protein ZapB n=1 Tax=Niastella soli TaxID=2821487 RepID=A0ABS3YLF8_9BACT|nr:cell division protein ZapB [Niastella soli]MBO9198710.1 cell division protein ZapB [Niastella soli]